MPRRRAAAVPVGNLHKLDPQRLGDLHRRFAELSAGRFETATREVSKLHSIEYPVSSIQYRVFSCQFRSIQPVAISMADQEARLLPSRTAPGQEPGKGPDPVARSDHAQGTRPSRLALVRSPTLSPTSQRPGGRATRLRPQRSACPSRAPRYHRPCILRPRPRRLLRRAPTHRRYPARKLRSRQLKSSSQSHAALPG